MFTWTGFFAIFAGFMYNDFFSVGLQIFDSRYKAPVFAQRAGRRADLSRWQDAGGGNFVPTFDATLHASRRV